MPSSILLPNPEHTFAHPAAGLMGSVLVACPDARPPAYQAVVGLARAGLLRSFHTAFYDTGRGPHRLLARSPRLARLLGRRQDPRIPADRVRAHWDFDLSLAAENRLAARWPGARRALARARTDRFDRTLARAVARERPRAAFVFSDVGSRHALPLCQKLGIPSILSVVHGDVREEREVLARESECAPDFLPIYLGDAAIDHDALAWLHERRLRDIALADRILVPSEHIAETLAARGTRRERIRVVPYAADTTRFVPAANKQHGPECTFLFAGGITQRKGIKYLLEAWRLVRRPGWRLQLLGALPRLLDPLRPYLDEVDLLGRVSHTEVPAIMAAADVFVFPSLFEGSAVVTYEALAAGLPCVVTPSAGSVVREGVEGFLVPVRDVETLAARMDELGTTPERRAAMSAAARARAEAFDWPRYHAAIEDTVREFA